MSKIEFTKDERLYRITLNDPPLNILDIEMLGDLREALRRVENDRALLVIDAAGEKAFSAGASVQDHLGYRVRAMLQLFHDCFRILYRTDVVSVSVVKGLALGGGCEVTMHASRVVAAAETYIGLVELGAGVIPAGGGTKEYMRRIINPVMKVENAEPFPFIQKAFLQIGQAKVATSAEEARGMGILNPQDRIVLNRDHLLTEAKREVLHMSAAGYKPPAPELIYAAGRDMYGAMKIGAWSFKEGKYITEYDSHIATKLAYVIAGGELTKAQWVSEQYILDLEREAFLSLCGEEKTQARMWSLLQTGKPLRN
jgi:Enoyl-CoA hydratase/carnithine racemase